MSIEVIEAAPSTLLTTVDTVKRTLGITVDTQDELIEEMIAATSDFIVRYTGRDFARQTVKESLPGKGVPELLLSLTPIINIEKTEFKGSDAGPVILVDRESGVIQREGGFHSTSIGWPTINRHPSGYYRYDWEVTYDGGYVLPGWGTSHGNRTLPYDIERAVVDIVKSQMLTKNIDGTMRSYKIGDTTIQWDRSALSHASAAVTGLVPGSALAVLNYYRRVF